MSKEWDAEAYHRISDPQFAWGRRVLERLSLRGDEHVLDAGSGSGRLTLELARRLPSGRVAAVDLSENMARMVVSVLAGALERRGPERRWEVVCANLLEVPFRECFDIVFSTATFHWIRDHERLFTELHDALRPGGRLEAQCGGSRNLEQLHSRAMIVANTAPFREFFEGWVDPWELPDARTTERRLRHAGFTHATCWIEAMPTSFPGAGDYRRFIEKVVMRPFLERLPTSELRARLVEAMAETASGDDPPFTLDYWRLNMSAVRD